MASGIAVTSILRHSLINRVDQTLLDASRSWAQSPRGISPVRQSPNVDRPPSNFYVRSIAPDGRTWTVVNDRNAEPALPNNNDVGPDPTTVRVSSGNAFTYVLSTTGVSAAGAAYCLTGINAKGTHAWEYVSSLGGLQPASTFTAAPATPNVAPACSFATTAF